MPTLCLFACLHSCTHPFFMLVIALLCSYCYQSGFFLFVCVRDYVHTICVCVLKVLCLQVCFQKQDCNCSFVAHSCPILGISRYSPGSKGFSEDSLIGCNLLFKLESQQASSLAVYKQLMRGNTNIAGHNWCTYRLPLPAVPSYLISRPSQRQIDSSCVAGLGVNSYSVVGPSGEEAQRGDLV